MPQKAPRPAGWVPDRAGLCDLSLAAGSGPSLKQNPSQAQAQQRLRRQQLTQQVHRLGARVLFELIDEIARHHGLGEEIDRRLERYARLDPDVLQMVGGNRFPVLPTRAVGGAP